MREQLKRIAEIFQQEDADMPLISKTIHEYQTLVSQLSAFDMEKVENRDDIQHSNGIAIGPIWAALCLREVMRTKNFIKGLLEAVSDKLSEQPDRPLLICYAGTGPFATLALPVMASFAPSQIQFLLIEIHEASHLMMQQVIQKLDMEAYVSCYLQEDASTTQLPHAEKVDILVTETMQQALAREQQVPITLNLLQQLREDVILIPERIQLDLALFHHDHFRTRKSETLETSYCERVSRIFAISKEDIQKHGYQPDMEHTQASLARLSREQLKKFSDLVLLTEIQVYRDIHLTINQCSLTIPFYIERLRDKENDLLFYSWYKMGQNPIVKYHLTTKKHRL